MFLIPRRPDSMHLAFLFFAWISSPESFVVLQNSVILNPAFCAPFDFQARQAF